MPERAKKAFRLHGVMLILLLAAVGLTSWAGRRAHSRGFTAGPGSPWDDGGSRCWWPRSISGPMQRARPGLHRQVLFGVLATLLVLGWLARMRLTEDELRDCCGIVALRQTDLFRCWSSVFLVGVLRVFIRPEWIESLAGAKHAAGQSGGRRLRRVHVFPDTGRSGRSPRCSSAWACTAGRCWPTSWPNPELSLQSILILSAIMGRLKTWTLRGVGWHFSAQLAVSLRHMGRRRESCPDRVLPAGISGALALVLWLVSRYTAHEPLLGKPGY